MKRNNSQTQPHGLHFACALLLTFTLMGCSGGDDGIADSSTDNSHNETVKTISDEYEYELPVIFHVLYKDKNDEKQYPTQKRLALLIDSVNAIYRRNHMNITFKMATEDENGKSLSEAGVKRHEVDFTSHSPKTFLEESSEYGEYTQDIHKFINVFLFEYDEENEGSMGMSVLPVMPSTHPLEGTPDTTASFLQRYTKYANPWGVTINNKYIQESQEWKYINPMCAWSTLGHELGHYLGLLHTFSENGCEEDDYCRDTRNSDYNAYIEELTLFYSNILNLASNSFWDLPQRTDCQTGERYFASNLMDYMYTTADSLTTQQRKRTRQVLNFCPCVPGVKLEESDVTRGFGNAPSRPVLFRPRLSD